MSGPRDALAPGKPTVMSRKVSSGTDDGGDIGLQGMSLADEHGSPPTSPSHPTMGRLFRLFGAHESNPLLDSQRSFSSGAANARGGGAAPRRSTNSRPASSSSSAASRTPSFTTTTTVARTGMRRSTSSAASGVPTYHQSAGESLSSAGPSPMVKTIELEEPPKGKRSTRTPRIPTQATSAQVERTSGGTSDAIASPTTASKGKGKERTTEKPTLTAATTEATDTSESRQSSSSSPTSPRRRDKDERKLEKQMSRLHTSIAGPVTDRPAAGTTNGPKLSPRRTSTGFMARRRSSQRTPSALSSPTMGTGADLTTTLSSPTRYAPESSDTSVSQTHAALTAPSAAKTGPRGLGIHTTGKEADKATQSLDELLQKTSSPTTLQRDAVPATAPPGRQSFETRTAATESPPLSVAALQRWVLSVGCVNFDLEKGPDLEFLYPSLGISREERDNIAFSSFPDTSIFDDGHAIFSWRVREVPLDASGSEAPVIATPSATGTTSDIQSPLSANDDSFIEHGNSLSATSGSTRKTAHHGSMSARRLFGALDRSRLNRSSSGDDGTAADKSRSATPSASNSPHIPASGSPDMPSSPTVDAKETHLTVPTRRKNSLASTMTASSTTEHLAFASAGQDISRTSSPAMMAAGDHAAALQLSKSFSAATMPRKQSSTSSNYIHGYCYFRQKRDATIRRGYFQKSVVILSHLPYVSFFSELVRKLGPLFFEKGMPILEAFCHDVQNWEPPEAGATMHLPLLGSVVSVELPYYSFSQASATADKLVGTPRTLHPTDGSRERQPILASIPSTPLFEVFREAIGDLWLLWECLLLAEPILVVGPDPTACSDAVWHMLDLIKPIPYAGDFRPFFTIHDYDFRTLVTKNKPSAGTIIGVTNPFMLQACKHWPNVLKVGRAAVKRMPVKKAGGTDAAGALGVGSGGGKTILSSGGGGIAGGNSAGGGGPEHKPGLLSKRKRRVSKDRPLIRQLMDAAEGKGLSVETANEILRKYFADQTERFLAPLNRYVSSLIPAEFDLSSASETPKIKPFNTTAFLASLKQHGTPLPIKSRNLPTGAAVRQSLYIDFLQCPNFSLWLHSRIRQSQEEQYMRKLVALEKGNVTSYASARGEVESMELYARLKVEIQGINERLIVGRRERELEPNSRWKSPNNGSGEGAAAAVAMAASTGSNGDEEIAGGRSIPSTPPASSPSPFLLDRLAALASTAASAAWIRQTIGEPGWQRAFTQGERTLLLRKAGLIDQLERLVAALPDDLRQTLRLNDHRARP